MRYRLILLASTFICLITQAKAQNFYKEKISREKYVQLGVGPSFMYADNAGGFRNVDFNIRPSISASMGKKINSFFDLKATLGYQFYKSQDKEYYGQSLISSWGENNYAVETRSNIVFMDVVPTAHLFKFTNHALRRSVNIYAGAGLGYLLAINQELRYKNEQTYQENKVRSTLYVPLRGGISYRLGLYDDISLEGSLFLTFSDKVEGTPNFNRFNDHLLQGQIVYRRYLSSLRSVN
ncbi:hypothetical protein [Lunatibacter salilacus]|uniref:hypothetical protein n=1 Tax=Lunatibacter salilacus TaxID=2483804 RepID=UPI00131AF153|nr:hypothetical protein [Lunatibacter salilacus]